MTDSRLPAGWLTEARMDGLSDRAWRTFTGSLMWSNEAGTDGALPRRALRFLHPEGVDTATLGELVDVGLWEPNGDGIQVSDWVGMGQETAEVVAWRKKQARERQQAWRDKQKPKQQPVMRDAMSDVTRDVGQEQRQGQKTEEQALDESETMEQAKRITSWATAVPGSGQRAS